MKFDLAKYLSLSKKEADAYRQAWNRLIMMPYKIRPENPHHIETVTHDEIVYGDGRMRREYPGLEEALEKEV